jgi:cytochrome c biogenesis protein CcdA
MAGLLTSLSPCVLPALPVVVGSAAIGHRSGPLALAGGMVAAFTAVGVTLAATGRVIGLDGLLLRRLAAVGLALAGLVLLSERLQNRLSVWLAPLASWAARRSTAGSGAGLRSQFGLGALLGAVWSPCTGPTLGAAVGLAAQGSIPRAALVMAVFGVGAALPLIGAAYAARGFGERLGLLRAVGGRGKKVLGWVLAGVGLAVFTGTDKRFEALLLDRLPDAWIDLLTRF